MITEECNRQLSYLKKADRDFEKEYLNPPNVTYRNVYVFCSDSSCYAQI